MVSSPWKRLKNHVRPEWLKAGRKWLSSRLKLAALARRYGLQPISGNPLAALKSSDTLFVLGSGASINTLSPAQWAVIAAADSVGFNNWHLHPFLPTLYINEPGKDLSLLRDEFANLVRRGYDQTGTLILLKDVERYRAHELRAVLDAVPPSVLPQVRLSWDWELHEQHLPHFERKLRWLDRCGLLTSSLSPILRKRASVFYIIMLALRAGYKKIVLCGIDLNNTDYFYEAQRAALTQQGYWLPEAKGAAVAHKTDDPAFGAITISSALMALKRHVLEPRRIELFVGLSSSRLYPDLPVYFDHAE